MGLNKGFKEHNWKIPLLLSLLFVMLSAVFVLPLVERVLLPQGAGNSTTKVCFGSACINAEIADTPESRSKGLMFREHLNDTEGMLFIFDTEGYRSFWMENTLIPLDMIWIDSNRTVVHIESAEPCKTLFCPFYNTPIPAKYVIEVNSGFAKRNRISIGDSVSIIPGK
jgi:uncharacterized membrane protein (UPF0127 family)